MAAVAGNVKHHVLRTSGQDVGTHPQPTPRLLGGLYNPVSDIKPFDVWHIISYGPKDPRENRDEGHRRDNSPDASAWEDEETPLLEKKKSEMPRVPILGPTRQQTEIYFKNLRKKKRLKPGSSHSLDASVNSDEAPHNDNFRSAGANQTKRAKETNDGDDETVKALEDLYNIAGETVSMLESSAEFKDFRFVSNLVNVKPLRYRVKNNLNKERVIFPSKHGFHPRSHSPTFKRLIDVTEKLQNLKEEGIDHKRTQDPFIVHRSDESLSEFKKKSFRLPHPDPNNQKLPCIKSKTGNVHKEVKLLIPNDFPIKVETAPVDETKDDKDVSDKESNDSEKYFKMDSKEEETLPELHLFLPQINDQPNTRGVTPEVPSKNVSFGTLGDFNVDSSADRVLLPNLRQNTKQINNKKGRENGAPKVGTTTGKKKKKKVPFRSASAEKDKRIPDHLNDVPTLISLNYEKDDYLHPTPNNTHRRHSHGNESNCPFGENCQVHTKPIQKV